jgi:hypothetical protein
VRDVGTLRGSQRQDDWKDKTHHSVNYLPRAET